MDNFEKLEADIMESIIDDYTELSIALSKQYRSAKIISREFSGFGFYTNFEIEDESLRLNNSPNLELGNVNVQLDGLTLGAGCILFIRDGLIQTLECYTYDEPWPLEIANYTVDLIC